MRNRLLLIALGVFLALLITETALRVLGLPRFHDVHSSTAEFEFHTAPNGEVFYTNQASAAITFVYDEDPRGYFGSGNAVVQHTNRFGFRGPDVRVEKPDSVIRVAFLGDSYTFGEGVHDADVFPEVVERILNGEHALVPGKTVQSLDFGVGGYNTEQSLFLLNHLVLSFSPDVVVLGYTLNDAEQALFYLGPDGRVRRRDREALVPEGVAERKPPARLLYRSRLAQEFWKIWWNRRTTRATIGYYRALYREDAAGWKATQDALSGIIETCRQHGIKLIVADLPILYRLNGPSPFASEYEKVRTFVEPKLDTDGVWLDLLSAVRGYRGPELWVHPTDQHPNERAHRLFAVRIAEAIRTLVGEAATSSG